MASTIAGLAACGALATRVGRSKKGITAAPVRGEVERSVRTCKGDRSLKVLAAVAPRATASAAQVEEKKCIL